MWSICDKKPVRTFVGHLGGISVISYLYQVNPTLIASGSKDKSIILWDLEYSSPQKVLKGHKGEVTKIVYLQGYTDNPCIASSSVDSFIRIWNIKDGECINTLSSHLDRVINIFHIPNYDNNLLISASRDKTIKIWDLTGNEITNQVKVNIKNKEEIVVFQANYDNKNEILNLIVVLSDKSLKIWQGPNFKDRGFKLRGHFNSINCLTQYTSHEQILTGSEDKTIKLWNIYKNKNMSSFHGISKRKESKGHKDGILKIVHLKGFDDNIIASSSKDGSIKLWNTRSRKVIKTLCDQKYHNYYHKNLCLRSDNNVCKGHTGQILDFIFVYVNGEYKIISCSSDNTIRIWEINNNTERNE